MIHSFELDPRFASLRGERAYRQLVGEFRKKYLSSPYDSFFGFSRRSKME
jgi:hypothetical protein